MTDSDAGAMRFAFPVLIGDIGGTNARFCVVRDETADAGEPLIVRTADFANVDDAIRATVLQDASLRPRTAILAIAAPVEGDDIRLTNCPWIMRPKRMLADLGPRTARDYEVFPHLETLDGRVSGEDVLCGRGLVNLYRAIARADGRQILLNAPSDITAAGLARSDAIAAETLDMFTTLLGRIAGDMALVFKARGGVFLSGGIAQKIVPALKAGSFRTAFEDKAPQNALMRTIPVNVVSHPLAALAGLAAFARTPSRFGIETDGRCWRV